jgi:Reverse transcriptase (RNA-dependent DNA polymerase)
VAKEVPPAGGRRATVEPTTRTEGADRRTPEAGEGQPEAEEAAGPAETDEERSEPEGAPAEPDVSLYGRHRKRTQRYVEVMEASRELEDERFIAFETMAPLIKDPCTDPVKAFKATSNPDTMYLHEALRQPDKLQFIAAMQKEVEDQMGNGNFQFHRRSTVPKGAQIIPGVWVLKRKCKIQSDEVYKWKACLNIDGSKQIKGVSYWETYAPVASWSLISLVLTISILNRWHSKQIDYVQAYPQAKAETDNLCMELPKGFTRKGVRDPKEWVLHMRNNVYGNKAAGRVWNRHLVGKLLGVGFVQSKHDECLFYFKTVVYILYTDDSIITGPKQSHIDEDIRKMQAIGLDITDEGDVGDFLGVRIDPHCEGGTVRLSQPHLIDFILKDLRLQGANVVIKDTPAAPNKLLK